MTRKSMAMGRQKIKIARIENINRRQITFSKRRSGLFKKASELCALCGVEMAIVVFSPGGRAFSFGCPNVDALIHRFLTQSSMPSTSEQMPRNVGVEAGLNGQLTMLLNLIEIEHKRGEELDRTRQARRDHRWWEKPIDELGMIELLQLRTSSEDLKKKIVHQVNKQMEAYN